MIYSTMGNPIERITDYDDDSGAVRFIRASDKAVRTCNVSQLKADGGVAEIEAVVYQLVSEAQSDWPERHSTAQLAAIASAAPLTADQLDRLQAKREGKIYEP